MLDAPPICHNFFNLFYFDPLPPLFIRYTGFDGVPYTSNLKVCKLFMLNGVSGDKMVHILNTEVKEGSNMVIDQCSNLWSKFGNDKKNKGGLGLIPRGSKNIFWNC